MNSNATAQGTWLLCLLGHHEYSPSSWTIKHGKISRRYCVRCKRMIKQEVKAHECNAKAEGGEG